jgi:SAM-dependent methyltransferase
VGTTEQLHDKGEEGWPTKLHVGCGGVYLLGYTNIDAAGSLRKKRRTVRSLPNITAINNYYKTEADWGSLPRRRETICDQLCDVRELDSLYTDNSVDKIVAVQVLEHLTPIDAQLVIDQFHSLLEPGGVLILSVPDTEGTLDWIEIGDAERVAFSVRHLRGTRRDPWSIHKSWWTDESLHAALAWVGFKKIVTLENFHAYPSVVMKAVKE